MSATLLPMPRAVFYDTNGNPLSGGKVFTYIPGGTTPKLTWQDAGEATPNANPITLDAAGSCLLYGSGSYSIVVTDSLGNSIPAYSGLTANASQFQAIGTGSIIRSDLDKLRESVSAADFGAVGDNVTDDTVSIQEAINQITTSGLALHLIGTSGSNFKITAPLNLSGTGMRLLGSTASATTINAHGNFSSILAFGASAAGIDIDGIGLVQTGTTTPCVKLATGAQVIKFIDCGFTGDLTGNLIYSQGSGYIEYWGCTWNCLAAGTQGIVLDGFNQNPVFMGGHAGGPGQWLLIENSTGNIVNNVQGLKATAFTSICTGAKAIEVGGAAFSTQFLGCIIDQAGTNCIVIDGASSLTQIIGGYWGLASTGVPIVLAPTCGAGTLITNVQTFGGTSSISVQATASARVGGVTITNNTFNAATTTTIGLDSVNGCIVTGNVDLSTPSAGSWSTANTFGNGAYVFGDNDWWTTAPGSFHSGSSYHARPDRGITLSNKGVAATASGTSIVVPHGLISIAPNIVKLTQLGGPGMNNNVSSISGGNFTITYGTSGAATFMWEAEYFT